MSRGNITRRGKTSWRLKFDVPGVNGERGIRYVTVKGKRQDAERELTRLLNEADRGTLVDPNKITLGAYLTSWLESKDLSPRSRELYLDIIERQINPVLGRSELQKLKPVGVKAWLGGLRRRDGRKLHSRTIRQAYRVLHGALAEAVTLDMIARNVADAVSPPRLIASRSDCSRADRSARLSFASYRIPCLRHRNETRRASSPPLAERRSRAIDHQGRAIARTDAGRSPLQGAEIETRSTIDLSAAERRGDAVQAPEGAPRAPHGSRYGQA
jgi:hypothetical protein